MLLNGRWRFAAALARGAVGVGGGSHREHLSGAARPCHL